MAHVEVLDGPQSGQTFALSPSGLVFGREQADDVDVALGTRWVSSRHGRIWSEGGRWFVEDAQSANGTFVERQKISRLELASGTEVTFANVRVRVVFDVPQPISAPPPVPVEPVIEHRAPPPPRPEPASSGGIPRDVLVAAEMLHDRCEVASEVYDGLEELVARLEHAVEDGGQELMRTAAGLVGPRGELREQLVDLQEILVDLKQGAAHLKRVTSTR